MRTVASLPPSFGCTAASLSALMIHSHESSADTHLLDMADVRLPTSLSAATSGPRGKLSRASKYNLAVGVFVAILSGLLAIMYLLTIMSLNQSANLRRMTQNADRRQFASLIRLYSREFVSPDDSFPSMTLVRHLRGTIADMVSIHEQLTNDVGGLSDTLPRLTSLPRVCSSAAACLSSPENTTIGYTLEGARLPLNAAMNRLAETATEVVTAMANAKNYDVFIATPHYAKFELLMLLCSDIMTRLTLLDVGITQMLNDRVSLSSLVSVVVFVVLLGVLFAGLTVAVAFGLTKLRRESRALTTVPFLLSQAVLQQVPELNAFLESGGLTLQVRTEESG